MIENKYLRVGAIVFGIITVGFLAKISIGFMYLYSLYQEYSENIKKCQIRGMDFDEFGNCFPQKVSR
jgi:hypothetical protein